MDMLSDLSHKEKNMDCGCGNRALKRMFKPKRMEVTVGWRKQHSHQKFDT
jgi:hypothetical protein